jgi:hypothetical protein
LTALLRSNEKKSFFTLQGLKAIKKKRAKGHKVKRGQLGNKK